jgi:hypothetical protein
VIEVKSSPKSRDAGFPAASPRSDRHSVRLVGFAVDVLDALVEDVDGDDAAAERAVRHYLEDSRLRPPGWSSPKELESEPEAGQSCEVHLEAASLEAIAAEAAAQGVRLETLVGHAVMYLWAAERRPDSPPAVDAPERAPGVSAPDAPPQGRRRVSPRTSGG